MIIITPNHVHPAQLCQLKLFQEVSCLFITIMARQQAFQSSWQLSVAMVMISYLFLEM